MHEHEAIIEYIVENLSSTGDIHWEHTDDLYYDVFKDGQWLFEIEFYGGNILAYYNSNINIICPLASPKLIEKLDKFLKEVTSALLSTPWVI